MWHPLKCGRGASFEHSLEAWSRPHEEKGCRPNPLELDSDTGGPGTRSLEQGRELRRLGPFWEGEDWGVLLRRSQGLTLAPAWGWAWRLEAAEPTTGRWGSEQQPGAHLFGAELVGRCRAPWSRQVFAGFALPEQGAARVAGLEDALGYQVPLLIMWRTVDRTRLASVRGSGVLVPCTTCRGARLGVDSAVYVRGGLLT